MSSAPQLDFAVWILDVGTFGIPVLVLTDMEPDAEAELVLPGSTRAVRTPEPLPAPAHQVHIHVEHLHIHVAGPEGLTDLQEAPH